MALIAITIDQREQDHILQQSFGVPLSHSLLDVGNLWGVCDDGTLLAVWRIAAGDLPTLIRRDLFARAGQLRDLTPWCYLVITDELRPGPKGSSIIEGRESGWSWSSIQGTLVELQALGVMVAHLRSDADYGLFVQQIGDVKRTTKRSEPPKDALFYTPGEAVLLSLPGIGEAKLDALLETQPDGHQRLSPALALVQLCDDSPDAVNVPGIGPETRRQARQALGLTEGQVLTIHMKEEQHEPASTSTRRAA